MKIVYCAQFRDSSGYAVASRGNLRSLDAFLQKNPNAFELKILPLSAGEVNRLSKEEEKIIKKYEFSHKAEIDETCKAGDHICLWHMPPLMLTIWAKRFRKNDPHWDAVEKLVRSSKENVNVTVWEADSIPEGWLKVYDEYNTNSVIVPSQWNKDVFSKQLGKKECFLVPHCVSEDIVSPKEMSIKEQLKDKFVIFSLSQWINRKGLEKLIYAYYMEFGKQEDVVLLLKSYLYASEETMPFKQQHKNMVANISRLKHGVFHEGDPKKPFAECPLILIPSIVPYENISWMYEQADVFALPTRGEGFGLTIAEAVMHKKPVIVPDKGGHVDFLKKDACFFTEGNWSPYINRPEYSCDMNWYEPHILSIRKQLRKTYNLWKEDNQKLKNMGEQLKEHFLQGGYDRESVGKGFYDVFCKIEKEKKSTKKTKTRKKKKETVSDITGKIKWAMPSLPELKDKVDSLRNKYQGKTCYILSCGPSLKDYTPSELKEKLKDELVLSVKQAYDYCPEICNFHFFNCSNLPAPKNGKHYDYGNRQDVISVASSNYPLGMRWNNKKQHNDLFFRIPIRNDERVNDEFVCVTKDFEKYSLEKNILRPCGPGIMYETVFHTAVHLGVKKIVLLGWDLSRDNPKKMKDYKHFYENKKLVNRGDILKWEVEMTCKASEDLYHWLKGKGIEMEIATEKSEVFEGIPRVKL